ncbi:unnamed protein product [Leptidea sinapis]|uniref:Strawberry notch AAA domain-containing protein n=1 Tax=Leptidea sinapis TaxID=189913 RepID=A0A5E4Q2M6_9NEOP|nr:unnamed protein product [Leptidea sinapis]
MNQSDSHHIEIDLEFKTKTMSKRGDNPPSDDDSDFDDDEDPDNLEVPGGGKTLAAAARLGDKVKMPAPAPVMIKPTTNPLAAPSGLAFGQSSNVKPIRISASSLTKPINIGIGRGRGMPVEMAGMQGLNPYWLQNLNQFLASGMGGPLAGMYGQLGQLGQLNQLAAWTNKGMWQQQEKMGGEEEEVDDEEMGVAETYADYMPTKLKIGRKHPDPVVETASLSSVEPVDVTYKLALPEDTIRSGALSALQLEAVVYTAQAHEHTLPDGTRAGFLIGDGAGVGKGRTIAGIIFENYMRNRRRAIWVSVSNDLKYDAERDLRDIGANCIDVHSLSKISSGVNSNVKKGVIFCTYSALIGETSANTKYRTRLKQLLQWCGEDFDGLIVFDECHKAKNLCPVGSGKATKTGLTALELQTKLPRARVVYASATGASEPRNMAYMVRLGIWGDGTPFPTFMDFINAVEKSFHGVSFKIEEVPLSDSFKDTYDKAVALWVEAMQRFTEAAELIDAEARMKKTMWGQFWSAHQRFFKGVFQTLVEKHFPAPDRERINRLLGIEPKARQSPAASNGNATRATAAPVPASNGDDDANTSKRKLTSRQQANVAAKRARGGSSSDEFVRGSDDDIEEPESDEDRPHSDSDLSDFNPFRAGSDSDDDPWVGLGRKKKQTKKKKLSTPKKKVSTQDKIETMFEKKNTSPASTVTMTGRKGRVVQTEDGQIVYESRAEADIPLETLNLAEKKRFMDGEKDVAIISEAASSGISLQSDRRWDIFCEKYKLLLSHMSFGSGRTALEAVMKAIMKYETPLVAPPKDYRGDFFQDLASALVGVGLIINSEHQPGDYNNMSKFLNRILGMPVELQNRLFKYFTDTLAARGLDWLDALEKSEECVGAEGFYLSQQARNGKYTAVLCIAANTTRERNVPDKDRTYQLYRYAYTKELCRLTEGNALFRRSVRHRAQVRQHRLKVSARTM